VHDFIILSRESSSHFVNLKDIILQSSYADNVSFAASAPASGTGRGTNSRFMIMRGQTSSKPGCLPKRTCWNTFRIVSLDLMSDQFARKKSTCTFRTSSNAAEKEENISWDTLLTVRLLTMC